MSESPCRWDHPIRSSCSLGQRFGHHAVVVHRHHVLADPLQQRLVGVGAEHRIGASDRAERRDDGDAAAVLVDRRGLGVLVDPHAEFLGDPLQLPRQLGGIDEGRSAHPVEPAGVGRRVDLGTHRVLIEPPDLLAHRAQQIVFLPEIVEIRRWMVDVGDVDHAVAFVVAVHRVPLDGLFDLVEIEQAELFERCRSRRHGVRCRCRRRG